MSDLRPTLFLAQLSNLLAGNISIVHGVTGSSRTFMGEEGGRRRRGAHRASRASRPDRARSRWSAAPRTASARRCCCSTSSAVHSHRRIPPGVGTRPSIRALRSARWGRSWCWKAASTRAAAARSRWRSFLPSPMRGRTASRATSRRRSASCGTRSRPAGGIVSGAIISGATGVEPATAEERAFLESHPDLAGARHRHPYRPRRGAAIRDEHRARGDRRRSTAGCSPRMMLPASSSAAEVR